MLRIFFLFLFGFVIPLEAKVVIYNETQRISHFELEYYYDNAKTETIESIQNINFQDKTPNMFTFGFISGNSWFKLIIENKSKANDYIFQLVEPFFQRIYFYNQEDGNWTKQSAGLKEYAKDKNPQHLMPIFPFHIDHNETKTFYIQFAPDAKTAGSSFGEFRLASQNNFNHESLMGNYIFYFIFLGSILIIIIFNFFLFFKFHDLTYLYYALYNICLALYMSIFFGVIHHFGLALWYRELSISFPLLIVFMILFSTYLLKLSIHLPLMHKLLKLFSLGFIISLFFMFYDYSTWMKMVGIPFMLFITPLPVGSAFYIAYKGDKEVKFYIFGSIFYIVSLVFIPLMTKAIIPNTIFTHSSFLFFSYIEILFFSFIIVNRFYNIQNDKILLQEKLLQIQRENEKVLEKKVEERSMRVNKLLQEKEMLLKEMYHRVKNNFQVVIGLLWIEASKKEIKSHHGKLLFEIINRIKSMSLIHSYLLESTKISDIESKKYLMQIINQTKKLYSNDNIIIQERIDHCTLSVDEALSLGIIINEILTNAIKYHNNRDNCKINLSFLVHNNQIRLLIKDNGVGYDPDINSSGFGIKMVMDFAKNLSSSKIEFIIKDGTEFILDFESFTSE